MRIGPFFFIALLFASLDSKAKSPEEDKRVVPTRCWIFYDYGPEGGRKNLGKHIKDMENAEYIWPREKRSGILGKLGVFNFDDLKPTFETLVKQEAIKRQLTEKCGQDQVRFGQQNFRCGAAECRPGNF